MTQITIDSTVTGYHGKALILNGKPTTYRDMYIYALLNARSGETMSPDEYLARRALADKLIAGKPFRASENEIKLVSLCISCIPNLEIYAGSNLIKTAATLGSPVQETPADTEMDGKQTKSVDEAQA
jgi:hypothetical protein